MPYEHIIPDLRLGEFDLGGVLYHANYYHLYEQAREALLRSGGTPYHQLVAEGFHLAVVEAEQRFERPIAYGDSIRIHLSCTALGASTVTLRYEIAAGPKNEERKVHSGTTKLAFIANTDGRFKPSRMPEKLVTIFKKIAEK